MVGDPKQMPPTSFFDRAESAEDNEDVEPDLESILAARPHLDSGQIVALAMVEPTPEMRWACMLGFRPAHLLRRYGALAESVMLFERIRVAPVGQVERAA